MVEKEFFVQKLAHEIRNWRLYRGYTMENLAELADISVNYLGRIERGEAEPKSHTLYKLCHALEISPKLLFQEIERNYKE